MIGFIILNMFGFFFQIFIPLESVPNSNQISLSAGNACAKYP